MNVRFSSSIEVNRDQTEEQDEESPSTSRDQEPDLERTVRWAESASTSRTQESGLGRPMRWWSRSRTTSLWVTNEQAKRRSTRVSHADRRSVVYLGLAYFQKSFIQKTSHLRSICEQCCLLRDQSNARDVWQLNSKLSKAVSQLPLARLSEDDTVYLLKAAAMMVGVTRAHAAQLTLLTSGQLSIRACWRRKRAWWNYGTAQSTLRVAVREQLRAGKVDEAMRAVLECCHERRALAARDASLYLIHVFLELGVPLSRLVTVLTSHAEVMLRNSRRGDAKQTAAILLSVVSGIELEQRRAGSVPLEAMCLMRLLSLLHEAVEREADQLQTLASFCVRSLLRLSADLRGLSLCVVASRAADASLTRAERLDLAQLLVHAAAGYTTRAYKDTLTEEVLPPLVVVTAAEDRAISLLGCKTLLFLLDRMDNARHFLHPQVFSTGGVVHGYPFRIRSRRNQVAGDAELLCDCQDQLHHALLEAVTLHASTMDNLCHAHAIACLLVVEVPSPIAAINVAHLAVAVQDRAVAQHAQMGGTVAAYIHACAASLMSLVCHVHEMDAPRLCELVEEVIEERRVFAPYLLPPLIRQLSPPQQLPEYPPEPQLLFDEREVRFALQRSWLTMRGVRKGALVILP